MEFNELCGHNTRSRTWAERRSVPSLPSPMRATTLLQVYCRCKSYDTRKRSLNRSTPNHRRLLNLSCSTSKVTKVDMQRVLNRFKTNDWSKIIHALTNVVPREEYCYLGGTRCIEFIFVVEEGYNKEALEKKPFEEPEGSYLRKMANEILVPGVYTSCLLFAYV
jgi:hypothetical protein